MIEFKIYHEGDEYSTKRISFGPMFTDAGFRGIYFLYQANRFSKRYLHQIVKVRNEWKNLKYFPPSWFNCDKKKK